MLIDLDDTVLKFNESMIKCFGAYFRKHYTIDDFDSYDAPLRLYGLTEQEFYETLIGLGVYVPMKAFDGAREAIIELSELLGKKPTYLTSRGFHPTAKVISEHNIRVNELPEGDIIVKPEGKRKIDCVNVENHSIFVDDHIDNLLPFVGTGIDLFMVSMPWNRGRMIPREIRVVNSITEVPTILKEEMK